MTTFTKHSLYRIPEGSDPDSVIDFQEKWVRKLILDNPSNSNTKRLAQCLIQYVQGESELAIVEGYPVFRKSV
jgi:hypothetical protein